ncbi:MAG: hypothetical protein E6J74_19495 [Deltaproteobacteria bacterium]|jgi:hypothetical protein|nr:MAG: hypothetical protein E6J74_19495 [Deltaproteobacteria bacterium]
MVTANETRDNYDEGISITGSSGTGNIVTAVEISHNNAGANLDQGIEVSGGSGQDNQVSSNADGVASCILTFGRKQGDTNLFLDRMKGIGEGKMYRESFPPG